MIAIKQSAKPKQQSTEELLKVALAKIAALEAESAVKATKGSRKAKSVSTFTKEDVLSFEAGSKNYTGEANTWFDLKEQFIDRNADGTPKMVRSKSGFGDRVVVKKGLDYGVYRFIKGIARQMNGSDFDGLSEKQVAALQNILQYCADHDLIETPEVEAPVVEKKAKAAKK